MVGRHGERDVRHANIAIRIKRDAISTYVPFFLSIKYRPLAKEMVMLTSRER